MMQHRQAASLDVSISHAGDESNRLRFNQSSTHSHQMNQTSTIGFDTKSAMSQTIRSSPRDDILLKER